MDENSGDSGKVIEFPTVWQGGGAISFNGNTLEKIAGNNEDNKVATLRHAIYGDIHAATVQEVLEKNALSRKNIGKELSQYLNRFSQYTVEKTHSHNWTWKEVILGGIDSWFSGKGYMRLGRMGSKDLFDQIVAQDTMKEGQEGTPYLLGVTQIKQTKNSLMFTVGPVHNGIVSVGDWISHGYRLTRE